MSIDIDEFSPEDMLQGLIDAHYLTEEEAEKIEKRADRRSSTSLTFDIEAQSRDELEIARDMMRIGKRIEALIHLERFLGREWIGVLQ